MAFIGQDAVLAPSQRLWEKEQRRARRQGFRRPHLGHGAEAARQLAGKPRGPRCPLKRRRDPCRICPRSTHLRGGQRSPWHPPPRECPSTHANVRKSPAQSQGRRSRPAVTAPPVQAAPRPASRAGSLVPRLLPQCWTPPPCPSFSRLGHSAPATRVQSEVPPGPVRGGAGRERTRTRSPRRWLRGLSGKPGRGLRTRAGRRKRVGRCRAKHRSRKAERSPGRPPHAHSPLGRAAGLEDARSETDAERPPERMRTQRLAQLRLLDRSSGARMRDGPRARVGRCLAGGGGRWGDRRCCCSRCAQLAPGDSTSTSARPRSAASSRKSPTRPWSSVRRGEGGQGLRVSQTRPRRPAESGSRPEQAGRDGCVCSAGNYRTQMWDKQKEVFLPSTPGLGMHVEVKDPEGKVVLSRQYGSEGRFTFTSHMPGDHQICLHSNSTRMALFAGGRLRVHLDIQVGEHANNYPEIAAKDKLTELQLRARQLLDQVEQIQKEQDYQRYREERFRLTSESTNQRVLWWSIAQTAILLLTGIWQMRHLKSFFEAKKLV
uniref:Transmembrane p24 trafficking protein 4 n=1 Tax=Canis lupus familiaris TaxID=9615 RepID=A0A8P0PPG2_CANLF